MKLLLIKVGKALSAMRQEGIVAGGRRVVTSFIALFRHVGSGDILFITGGVGDSARYRCDHVAEELRLNGFRVSVTVQDNPFLVSYASKFSVFIFHRTLHTSSVKKLIQHAKELKKEVIFDTDDLVYDPAYLTYMDIWKKMNVFERKQYENGVGGEIISDPYVSVCTTTTRYLKKRLMERGKKVFLVPNRVNCADAELANRLVQQRKNISKNKPVSIAYFSGTKSHDKDFCQASEAILRILETYPETELVLAGPIHISGDFSRFEKQVRRLAFVPREENFRNIASIDINIAPLEVDNPFCEAKSELKFFEAGLCSVPTVASATQTFRDAIEDGKNGYIAESSEEWFQKLSQLVRDGEIRKKIGLLARETVLQRYLTSSARNEAYYAYLRNCLKK